MEATPAPARLPQRRLRRARTDDGKAPQPRRPPLTVTKPLPRVLLLHTGGTLGMDPVASFECTERGGLRRGTGGIYAGAPLR